MSITSINTVNLYRIQGSNSKISRKRIVYKPKTEEIKILFPENNIYLSTNNEHHYYFTMKQISKLMKNIAKENGDTYCRTFKKRPASAGGGRPPASARWPRSEPCRPHPDSL